VGFSPLLDTNTTVHTGINKAFTTPTNQSPILHGQPNLRAHGDSPGDFSIALRQPRFFMDGLFRQAKKNMNAFHGNAFGFVHSVESTPRYVAGLEHISIGNANLTPLRCNEVC
jgi:hypothetical protein